MTKKPHNVAYIFRLVYGDNRNIITPHRVKFGYKGDLCYELSRGTGMDGSDLWGVTVVEVQERPGNSEEYRQRPDLSIMLTSRTNAELFIKLLKHPANAERFAKDIKTQREPQDKPAPAPASEAGALLQRIAKLEQSIGRLEAFIIRNAAQWEPEHLEQMLTQSSLSETVQDTVKASSYIRASVEMVWED